VAKSRASAAGAAEARQRFRIAEAYLDVASLVLGEGGEILNVSASLAVLGGIAASDAICARRLGKISRGEDHRAAAQLLQEAVPDGAKLAADFLRLIDLKSGAQYGVLVVSLRDAKNAVKWATKLVDRAREELER
jgi:hypothetical protein